MKTENLPLPPNGGGWFLEKWILLPENVSGAEDMPTFGGRRAGQ